MKQLLSILVVALLLTGCKAYEKVIYLQDAGRQAVLSDSLPSPVPDPILKPGDLLMITINTNTPEAAIPFNLPIIPAGESSRSYGQGNGTYLSYGFGLQNYLIDMEGYMTFPVLGKLKVAGLTKSQLSEQIKSSVYPRYLNEEPIILIRFANYKISVLGEVVRPGSYNIDNEKVSILDALALAGDISIYGNRQNILLIREVGNQRNTIRIDLRDGRLINSEYYYLQQNDVLYVEPNKTKARNSAIGTAETITISVVGTLVSLTTLVINVLR